jgi:CheY-like chemotaxis protein
MIHIMVVDDERDIERLFLQKFRNLIKAGTLGFHFAFSGEEALDYLRSTPAADLVLILSDINMPGMSGIDLLGTVEQQYAHLKVFMITAYDDKDKYQKSLSLGAEQYLTKPIDFHKLETEILAIEPRDAHV